MLRINKVIFPTDFSACAERAFAHAAFLALHYEATLHVLHVAVLPGAEQDDWKRRAQEPYVEAVDLAGYMRDLCGELETTIPIVYAREADLSAAMGILSYARQQDADLIVMGTHGRRGLDHVLMGSVAEEVVRTALCPVFTIGLGAPETPRHAIRRILVPVDFSEYGGPALAYAKDLAAVYQAQLDLLHVVEEVGLPSAYGSGNPVRFTVSMSELQANSRHALSAIGKQILSDEVPFEVHALIGNAALDLVDFVDLHDIDLIVMTTHGRTGIRRLVIGSVAEKVVRMAPCPVFTVKSFGKSLLGGGEERASTAMNSSLEAGAGSIN